MCSADLDMTAGRPTESIGVAGFCIANNATRSAWALYSDVQFESGQYGYGLELAVKNKSGNLTSTPYLALTGTYGIQLSGGGDASYGGAPTNPNNTGIIFVKNASTWNKGIVFVKDSLTGDDGTTGTATAIEMGKGHIIQWREPGNNFGFSIRSDVNGAGVDMSMVATNNTLSFFGAGGTNLFLMGHSASAVNYWQAINRATTAPPLLQVLGSDTDIDAAVQGKGAFGVRLRAGDASTKVQVNTTGVGLNGNAPVAKVTGWGTPTGQAVVANFPGATATLLQTSTAVAQLITDLKAIGVYGA